MEFFSAFSAAFLELNELFCVASISLAKLNETSQICMVSKIINFDKFYLVQYKLFSRKHHKINIIF